MSFFSQKSLGERVFNLISAYSLKLTQVSSSKKYTFIEAHALMFMEFFSLALLRQGEREDPKFDRMLVDINNRFKALPDQDAKMILLSHGYRSMNQFVGDRSIYFKKYLETYFNSGEKAVLSGVCYALYHKPLSRIEYFEEKDGNISLPDKYNYNDLSVIFEFTVLYNKIRKEFEKEILNLLLKEL